MSIKEELLVCLIIFKKLVIAKSTCYIPTQEIGSSCYTALGPHRTLMIFGGRVSPKHSHIFKELILVKEPKQECGETSYCIHCWKECKLAEDF